MCRLRVDAANSDVEQQQQTISVCTSSRRCVTHNHGMHSLALSIDLLPSPPSSSSSLCTNCLPTPTLARAWRMACLHALDRHCKIALRRMSDSSRRSADRITSERRKDSALLPLCNKHVSGSAQRSMPSTVHSQRFVAALPMASLQLHRNGLNAPSLLPTCLTTLTTATTTATSPHNVSNCFLPPPLRSRPPICCCALRTGGLVCAPHQVCGRSRSNGEQFTQL